ncbi:MAG: hypothetical protein PHQ78_02635 [Candidatus Cloacimonetes bacterium]|jgi:hypothetical protein|nr:hypothetical protein [Candidatus Cloacimonadota bacterium]MDD2506196.1 hypothetical protein [Candidatus Cloacimonadota bacterium]MDD4559366.1 hypothetical protein [Candidatus Cloacimonadota bacterium]
MNDLNDKIEERWRSRRKKGYNWPRLIVMLLVLVALIYAMTVLKRMGGNQQMIMSAERDSVETGLDMPEPSGMEQNP